MYSVESLVVMKLKFYPLKIYNLTMTILIEYQMNLPLSRYNQIDGW